MHQPVDGDPTLDRSKDNIAWRVQAMNATLELIPHLAKDLEHPLDVVDLAWHIERFLTEGVNPFMNEVVELKAIEGGKK